MTEASNLPKYLDIYNRLISRKDVWAQQTITPDEKGKYGYTKMQNPLTDDILKISLLNNSITIGAYTINPENNTVTNPQIDIDKHHGDVDVAAIAKKIYDWFKANGAYPYIEGSSGRIENGAHVALATKPTPAIDARDFLLKCLEELDINNCEVFPKQPKITSKDFGNLVKLPFQYNNRSKERSLIINPETMLPFHEKDALEFMTNLKNTKIPKSTNTKTPNGDNVKEDIPAPTNTNKNNGALGEYLKKVRDCFSNVYNQGIQLHGVGDDGHNFRFYAACEFIAQGAPDAIIHEYFSIQSDYDKVKTQGQLNQIRSKGYSPTTCDKIKEGSQSIVIGNNLCDKCFFENARKNSNKESEYKPTCHIENGCIGITKSKKELDENKETITIYYFEALTNFTFEYVKEVSSIDYETKKDKTEFETKIVIGDKKISFNVDVPTLSKNELFENAIKNACGSDAKFKHHDITTIREAFNDFMESSTIEKIKKVPMGWNKEEYVMKSVIITKERVKKNDKYLIDVPETSTARYIDMMEITDEQFKTCGEGYIKNFFPLHDRYFIQMALADCYGAPFQRRLGDCKNIDEYKFPKIDRGNPGAGKSFVERLIQSHFGIFPSDDSYITWGSTTYAVESEGGNFRDVIYLADDLSKNILNNDYEKEKFHKILHNYVSGTGRTRLKQSGELNHTKPIGGMLEITAENTVTEGQSNVGRVFYSDAPSLPTLEDGITLTRESQETFDKRKEYGIQCHSMKHLYPGFMARYILEVIQNENWLEDYADSYIKTQTEFLQLTGTGDYRSIKMHAIRYVHFEMFCNFMVKKGFMTVEERIENLSFLKDKMVERIEETSTSIKNERPIEVMINKLTQLLGNGTIPRAQRHDIVDDAHNKNPIGVILDDMKKPDLAFLIPDSTHVFMRKHAKESGKSFEFTQEDIGKELKALGMIKLFDTYKDKDGKIKERNTYKIRFNGSEIRTWCVSRESIGIPDAVMESQIPLFDVAMMSGEMFDRLGLIDNNPPTIKQYNMVMAQLITASRPDLSKSEKNRVWKELDKYVKLYCAGRKWIITVKVNEESIKDGESQIKQLSEQKPQQPLIVPEISKLNNLSTNYPINLTEL